MAGRHCVWGGRAGGGVNSAEISDTWTGAVTFVVNQPLAHLHLPLSGCDKHVSLSPVTALRMGGCVKSTLQTCPRAEMDRAATSGSADHEGHCNVLTSCTK